MVFFQQTGMSGFDTKMFGFVTSADCNIFTADKLNAYERPVQKRYIPRTGSGDHP